MKRPTIAYLHWLKLAAAQRSVAIHAYALMTNHVGARPDSKARADAYASLLDEGVPEEQLNAIRSTINTNQALGTERFKAQIEAAHRGRVRHLSAGRKPKQPANPNLKQQDLDL